MNKDSRSELALREETEGSVCMYVWGVGLLCCALSERERTRESTATAYSYKVGCRRKK